MSELVDQLRQLGLRATAAQLSDVVARATKERWGAAQILENVADIEEKDRAKRSLERRLSRSRLGRFKPMADFDWSWPTKIDRDRIESVVRLDFLSEARNVVLVAPQGLGKTMIAQNIAHEAILAGHSVLVVTAAQLLLDLGAQDSARSLDRRLRHYAKQSLLVVDEVGYLAFDNREEDLERVLSTAEEDEERAAASLVPDAFLRESRQPIERQPHVDGLEREVDLDAGRDHPSTLSARTTSRSSCASNPWQTARRAPSMRTSIVADGGISCSLTTRARATGRSSPRARPGERRAESFRARLASSVFHQRSDDSATPCIVANACAV